MTASYRSFVECAEANANSKDRQALNITAEANQEERICFDQKRQWNHGYLEGYLFGVT